MGATREEALEIAPAEFELGAAALAVQIDLAAAAWRDQKASPE